MEDSRKSIGRISFELATASFLVLFQELTLIRWLGEQVRVLAYFPNLILLSAFLGLGLGCLRGRSRSLAWLWPTALLVVVIAAAAMGRIVFTQESTSEHLWLLYYDLPSTSMVVHNVQVPILLAFLLSTATFVPLGQIVGQRLQDFNARSRPLLDIAGTFADRCWG